VTGARFLVIGARGHAQEVAWSLDEQTRAEGRRGEFLFFDDAVPAGPLASGLGSVVGPLDAVEEHARRGDARLVLGIGLPRTKTRVVTRFAALGVPWATVIHPGASLGRNVSIGEGSYIGPGAIVTVNVQIGRFVTVNTHCLVAHEDVLGDFVTLHPDVHLSGNVSVEEGAELGAGAVVIPGITVGAWAVLGAGTVVVRPVQGERTYVGVPARELVLGEEGAR
jgi:sugar O-acyltransferase (sialic acid O-acetyltransferase NeuD family)